MAYGQAGEQPAVRAVQAVQAFGTEYKRWVDSRLPRDAEVTPARLRVLGVLAREAPLTMGDLSRRLGTTPHNVTKLVDWLETQGLVERRREGQDRRAVTLRLTSTGQAAEQRYGLAHTTAVAEVFADLTDPELAHLTELLDRLRGAISRRMG